MSVSTTHRRPRQASSMRTCKASCADRPGRNPKLHGRKSASKTGSSTIFTAACTIRSRTAEMASGRYSSFRPGLGISTPRGWQRPVPPLPQPGGQLVHEPERSVLALDLVQGGLVDAGCAVAGAHRDPATPQDVSAVDLVPQRMKPSSGIGLGRPVKRVLQGTHLVQAEPSTRAAGLAANLGTHRAPPSASARIDEAGVLPSPPVMLSGRFKQ